MIVISEIKVFQTDLNPVEIAQQLSRNSGNYNSALLERYVPPEITTEMVLGRRYVNYQGEEVCIGMSKQAQDAIGLPFEVFDNMQNTINFLRKECDNLNASNFRLLKNINRYKSLDLFGRIKFLVTRTI